MFYYMHNNNNYQCKMCWNKALTFGVGLKYNSFFVPSVGPAEESSHLKYNGRKPLGFLACCIIPSADILIYEYICIAFCQRSPIYIAYNYELVGGAISIRDPYICAVHESVPTHRTLSSTYHDGKCQ